MYWKSILLLLCSVLIESKRPTCSFDPFCFMYTNGCSLSGCSPYKSFPNVTCDECVRQCEQDQDRSTPFDDWLVVPADNPEPTPSGLYCKSIVYNCETQTCNMYCDDDTGRGKLTVDSRSIYLRYSAENCPLTTPSTVTEGEQPVTSCPAGQTAKMIMVHGYSYKPGLTSDHQEHLTEHECGDACLNNALPGGGQFDCHSAQYHNGECILSGSQATAENSDNLEPDAGSTFFQKFCFDSELVAGCTEFMEQAPQKVLVGQNKQTLDASSVQDCFQHCLRASRDFGFECNSAQFFAVAATQNCILNVESHESRPDLYIDFQQDKVTYFAPHCHGDGALGGGGGALGGGPPAETPATPPTPGEITTQSLAVTSAGQPTGASAGASTTVASTVAPSKKRVKKLRANQAHHFKLIDLIKKPQGLDEPVDSSNSQEDHFEWSLWSLCGRPTDVQVRYRQCDEADARRCQRQTRPCRFETTTAAGSPPSAVTASPRPLLTITIDPEMMAPILDPLTAADQPIAVGVESVCRAIVGKNGVKTCRMGIRTVDGVRRYCSRPIDC